MTREEQIERVRDAVVNYLGTRLDFQPWSLAERIVDALAWPDERHFTDEEYQTRCNELVRVVKEIVDLRRAAKEAHDALDHIVGHTHQAHPRARTALDRLHAALEAETQSDLLQRNEERVRVLRLGLG